MEFQMGLLMEEVFKGNFSDPLVSLKREMWDKVPNFPQSCGPGALCDPKGTSLLACRAYLISIMLPLWVRARNLGISPWAAQGRGRPGVQGHLPIAQTSRLYLPPPLHTLCSKRQENTTFSLLLVGETSRPVNGGVRQPPPLNAQQKAEALPSPGAQPSPPMTLWRWNPLDFTGCLLSTPPHIPLLA